MPPKMFRKAIAWGTAFVATTAAAALAQCPTCAPPPVMNACPTACCNVCETVQPVIQPCYQTVPVTEYRPMKRTVQKPVCDVEYVDQQVTEYRPITEQKTAEVPTVNWQTVTECRTVQRDMGCWTTQYECRQKCSPCAYDPRPGIAGWWNRTSYSMRTAFQPTMVARRVWVPNVVTQQIPVTRQVAQYGTRQVCYNVTRMEPYTATRKVAVNKVRYVAEEVTEMQPVTVMRTIPTGTTVAWATVPNSCGTGASTALAPTPDPQYSRGSGSSRTADRNAYDEKLDTRKYSREAPAPSAAFDDPPAAGGGTFLPDKAPVKAKQLSSPVVRPTEGTVYPEARSTSPEPVNTSDYGPETVVPSMARSGRWTARPTQPASRPIAKPESGKPGPVLAGRGVTLAEKSP